MDGKEFIQSLKFSQVSDAFLSALHQPLTEKLQSFFESAEAAQGTDGFLAQIAAGVFPREASLADLQARQPYNNLKPLTTGLQEAAERGWIEVSETGFKATGKALKFTKKLVGILSEYTASLDEGLTVDVVRIMAFLDRLVGGAEAADFTHKPTFTFARNYEYAEKTPSLLWVRRHLITLGGYRDDCHIDAWQEYDVPGNVWEALTFLWRGDANTAAELAEKLPYRSYEEADYAGALDKLVELGWAEKLDEGFGLTEKGKRLREEAETQTNKNYQAAFVALSEEELATLIGLIEALTAATSPEVEEGK